MPSSFRSLCALFVCLGLSFCAPASQKITDLPGLKEKPTFDQYAGYVTVDAKHGRNLFYWFVESQRNPSTDPVLIWLNGGPGASSLLGFFTEHGPFRVNPDKKTLNVYPESWNKIANIIYLEAPAGVGFSYSDTKSDYHTGDNKTAADNYVFLTEWFKLFPEYKSNDFYVTGESYGGHYCPQLANLIYEDSLKAKINMKGMLIGNPGTEDDWFYNTDEYAFVTFMYTHGLLPPGPYIAAVEACGWHKFLTDCSNNFTQPSKECKAATTKILRYIPQNYDPYSILAPVCHERNNPSAYMNDPEEYVNSAWQRFKHKQGSGADVNLASDSGSNSGSGGFGGSNVTFEPCLSHFMHAYLNIPAVQKALHVKPTQWGKRNIHYGDESMNIVPYYEKLHEKTDWRMAIFSGTADSSVPFLGTIRWIECLKWPIKKDWRNWEYNKQVAGSIIDYEGISFITIKGAGHMVPYYMPEQGYAFYANWLEKKF